MGSARSRGTGRRSAAGAGRVLAGSRAGSCSWPPARRCSASWCRTSSSSQRAALVPGPDPCARDATTRRASGADHTTPGSPCRCSRRRCTGVLRCRARRDPARRPRPGARGHAHPDQRPEAGLSFCVNVTAAVFFLFSGKVVWSRRRDGVGALIGGSIGGRLAGRMRAELLRRIVVVIASWSGSSTWSGDAGRGLRVVDDPRDQSPLFVGAISARTPRSRTGRSISNRSSARRLPLRSSWAPSSAPRATAVRVGVERREPDLHDQPHGEATFLAEVVDDHVRELRHSRRTSSGRLRSSWNVARDSGLGHERLVAHLRGVLSGGERAQPRPGHRAEQVARSSSSALARSSTVRMP